MNYVYSFPSRYTQNSTIATRIDIFERILTWYIYIQKISFRVLSRRCYGSLRNCCCCKLWASFVSHKYTNHIIQLTNVWKSSRLPSELKDGHKLSIKRNTFEILLIVWNLIYCWFGFEICSMLFSKSLKAFLLRYLVRREFILK